MLPLTFKYHNSTTCFLQSSWNKRNYGICVSCIILSLIVLNIGKKINFTLCHTIKTEADAECKCGDLFTLSRHVWTDMEIRVLKKQALPLTVLAYGHQLHFSTPKFSPLW